MAKLNRIQIKGFKSIKELDLELKDINILIGANGSGKSNFLSFFNMLYWFFIDNLHYYVKKSAGAKRLLYFGSKQTKEINFSLEYNQNSSFSCLLESDESDSLFIKNAIYNNSHHEIPMKQGFLCSPYVFENPLFKGSDYKIPLGNYVYHFQDTTPESAIKSDPNVNDNEYLRPNGSNLAAYLYLLKKKYPEHYNHIVSVIQLVAPFFEDFRLKPFVENENYIRLEWIHKEQKEDYFDVSVLSDGTLRFICLVTLLLQPDELLPEIIIIDEPELGLHPYAINLLSGIIKSVSTKRQLIISTQSTDFINNFEPEDIIVVDYKDNQSKFTRYKSQDLKEWLEDYSLGDLWNKNILGGRP